MIAVISSGDQDGPHPPLKQAVCTGRSKTWTVMGVFGMSSLRPQASWTAPPAQTLAHTAHPRHSSSITW